MQEALQRGRMRGLVAERQAEELVDRFADLGAETAIEPAPPLTRRQQFGEEREGREIVGTAEVMAKELLRGGESRAIRRQGVQPRPDAKSPSIDAEIEKLVLI